MLLEERDRLNEIQKVSFELKVGHKKKKSATFLKNDVSNRVPKPSFFANGQVQFKGSKSPAANSGNRVNRMALGFNSMINRMQEDSSPFKLGS